MVAKDRGRGLRLLGFGLVAAVFVAPGLAKAQQQTDQDSIDQRFNVPPPAPRIGKPAADNRASQKQVNVNQVYSDVPGVQRQRIPVNPSDPIAVVNGQVITRMQLADECVAREGKKILELLINRTLIEQALRGQKLEITAAEIDEEIDTVAGRFGIGREAWLRTLDKEKNISPAQYARDIIYPALALRKLCAGRVQVTPKDLQDAFESQYGDKLRCRMIMVDTLPKARDIWEELHKNPGGFENMAKERSMDPGTRSIGGLLAEPITRHAYPKTVADAAFRQLVDGDPMDRDPSHKPKDGVFTGPIQVAEGAWVILRREEVIPAAKDVRLSDEKVRKQTYEMIYQVKLTESMKAYFEELRRTAGIENKLTGTVKMANEEKDPDYHVDNDVKLMSNPAGAAPTNGRPTAAAGGPAPSVKLPPPAALSPEAAKQFENMRALKPGGGPPASSN